MQKQVAPGVLRAQHCGSEGSRRELAGDRAYAVDCDLVQRTDDLQFSKIKYYRC